MGKVEILEKINELMESIIGSDLKEFEQRDVVYLLVEVYKIKERELKSSRKEITKVLRHISFFRDWVVHTHLNHKEWFKEKDTLNNTKNLLIEIQSIIENVETKNRIESLWSSFEKALKLVTKDQFIFEK